MIVESPVARGRFAVDGAVVDERLYCLSVFCFAVLHEVFDDDVFPEFSARDALHLLDGVGDDGRERVGFAGPRCSPIIDHAGKEGKSSMDCANVWSWYALSMMSSSGTARGRVVRRRRCSI